MDVFKVNQYTLRKATLSVDVYRGWLRTIFSTGGPVIERKSEVVFVPFKCYDRNKQYCLKIKMDDHFIAK